jgi:hypothetical protein
MLISKLMEDIERLNELIRTLDVLLNDDQDIVKIYSTRYRIEETITSFNIYFDKIPEIEDIFKSLKSYYVDEQLKKKLLNKRSVEE